MTGKRGLSGSVTDGPCRGAGTDADNDGDADRRSTAELLAAREQEIEEMRRRLHELEKLDSEILPVPAASASHEEPEPEPAIEAAATAEKAEVDSRSIYVGNVDYACLPEDVQKHFQFCGTINRVTILTDSFGQPRGFAYVEFLEAEAVQNALLLNETELHGRLLKVSPKRTNIPGMTQSRGRHQFHPYSPFYPAYGKVPRFRRFVGYSPY